MGHRGVTSITGHTARMSRTPRLLIVLAATSLFAAGCSNDSSTPDATEAPPTTGAPTTEAPTTEAPTTDAPTTDAPTTEAPTTDAPTTEAPAELGSVLEVAEAAGGFTTLLAAVEAAGLTETLSSGQFTVLAPTDEAFAALGQETIDALLADPEQLATVLRNHVLPSPQDAELIGIMTNLLTIDGVSLPVVVDGDVITIGGATVVTADIAADNGIIHVIDVVLVPATDAPA
jgi:transforming growth factor-beta-induced protein